MTGLSEEKSSRKVSEFAADLKDRDLPLIHEDTNIEEVIDAMIGFKHSRLLYVVDDHRKLIGTISLGILIRHVFTRRYEPRVHPRFLISMITTETARHIMQKHPIFAMEEEEVGEVLDRMIRSNVKEIALVDRENRVIANLTMIDLLKFLMTSCDNHFWSEKHL
jgi:CBS domain-containing protein